MEDANTPTEAEVRLTALTFAAEFAGRDPKATAATILADAESFRQFLMGEDTNVRAN